MSYIDKTIISMRKNNSYIKTILEWVVTEEPFIDEIVLLARILDVLNKSNLAVSRNEVLTAFNFYYQKQFHGDKNSYLRWLCENFKVKEGTIVNTSKIRSQVLKKTPVVRFSEPKYPPQSKKIEKLSKTTGEPK